MKGSIRDHYLSIANSGGEPEPDEGWTENYPHDLPDWDWPDAPDPRIADLERASLQDQLGGPGALIWIIICTWITIGSMIYLASQVA